MRIPTMVVAVILACGLIGCSNGDDAKQQAKNGAIKGVQFGEPKPEPPMPEQPKPEPDVLQAKPNPPPKGLVQNVRAAAYRPQRLNELRQIALFFQHFANDHGGKAPKTDEEFIDYIKRDDGGIAKAIQEKYYILNLKVNMRDSSSVVAYESLIDGGGHQTARVDGSVAPVMPDDLRKLLKQE